MDILPYHENTGAQYVMDMMPNQFQQALHVSATPFIWYQANTSPMASMHESENFNKTYYGYSLCASHLKHLGISSIRKILHNAVFSLQETGNRVSFQMTTTELRVAPLEILRPPNIGTNVSLPYQMIEQVYVDPFIPELFNVIFTHSTGIKYILVYMLNALDVHNLKTALNILMGKRHAYFDASLAYRRDWPDETTGIRLIRRHRASLRKKEKPFLTVPRSLRIKNRRLVNNRSSSLVTSRPNQNRRLSTDYVKEKYERRNRSMSFSPKRWVDYSKAKTRSENSSSDSTSDSEQTLKNNPDNLQPRLPNGMNPSIRPFMAPQIPMFLRPPGVYNRYVPKASGMVQMPMQSFPRPMDPMAMANQPRPFLPEMRRISNYDIKKNAPESVSGRSSRSSDSAFENMPTLTEWNDVKVSGGRRIVKHTVEPDVRKKSAQIDTHIQDKVLREILDEVKTVRKQVRALKHEKGRSRGHHASASEDETTIAKSVSHSGKLPDTLKKTLTKRRKSKS